MAMRRELPVRIREEVEEYSREQGLETSRVMEEVTRLYNRMFYEPEEAVGVVTAQSLSEPATQMSLDHGERVILKNDGSIRIAKIGEFVDSVMEAFGKKEENGWDIHDFTEDEVFVPSITRNEKMEWRKISAISRHISPEKLVKIRTFSGREITATDSHSFVVRKGNSVVPVSGKELKTGDRIPSIKFLPENCVQSLKLEEVIGKERSFVKKPLPEKMELDGLLGWIFGAYLSEGNATRYYTSFSNVNGKFLSKVREFAGSNGFSFNEYDNLRGFSRGHDIRINSILLSSLMKAACGTGSSMKRVPYFAYSAREEFVSGLLRGYFDGDGNVSVDRGVVRTSSNSEELIDGIKLLLTRFGIFSNKQKGRQFCLIIPAKYAGLFRKKIGFLIGDKKERLDRLCEIRGRKEKFQDFTDMIGGFDDLLMRAARKLRYPTRFINSFTARQRIGRSTLGKYISIFENSAKKSGIDIEKELKVMKRMFNSDVVWDEIVEISHVRPSGDYVYDFTVEGTETFTTFDGIVTHNTMRTYHFAGTAGIQVTLGLPRLIEIYDAKKSPETPSMTIYLQPEFNSQEKTVEVAKRIKEVKLKDFVVNDVIDLINLTIKAGINTKKLKKFGLEMKDIFRHIKIKNIDVETEGSNVIVTSKKTENVNIHKLKYKVLESHIKGVKGISHVIVSRDEKGEWNISTLGSNLKKIFEIEGVDPSRTISNNIFEIYDLLGVEAARNAIIREAVNTVEEQGLGVDIRYVTLLADLMTSEGTVMGIGRYGVAGNKESVIARMAFEETKKHIIAASIEGMRDPLRGHVENIIMNQVIPMGTGAFKLLGKIPRAYAEQAGDRKTVKAARKPGKKAPKKQTKKTVERKPAGKKTKKTPKKPSGKAPGKKSKK